jgi:hypothetical protein
VTQGFKLANPAIPILNVARSTIPFVGLSTLGVLSLLLGQGLLAVNLFKLVRQFVEPLARAACANVCGCGSATKAGVKP